MFQHENKSCYKPKDYLMASDSMVEESILSIQNHIWYSSEAKFSFAKISIYLACKDLRSCHSTLTRKCWTNWKLSNSIWSIREVKLQGKQWPPKLDNQSNSPAQKHTSKNLCRNECWVRKTRIVIGKLMESPCGQI
jgi:hypothetical protein